jgi:hypothetical protein
MLIRRILLLPALAFCLGLVSILAADACECHIKGPFGIDLTVCSSGTCQQGQSECCGCGVIASDCRCCASGTTCHAGNTLGYGYANCDVVKASGAG